MYVDMGAWMAVGMDGKIGHVVYDPLYGISMPSSQGRAVECKWLHEIPALQCCTRICVAILLCTIQRQDVHSIAIVRVCKYM